MSYFQYEILREQISSICFLFLDSSMVEHSAVNRRVVGSSPTRGVFFYRIVFTKDGPATVAKLNHRARHSISLSNAAEPAD